MRYEFEMSDAESMNVVNALERLGNRLMDMALFTSKMGDLEREIKNLKSDLKKMDQDERDLHGNVREIRAMHKMLAGNVEDQQKMLEDLKDSKSKK